MKDKGSAQSVAHLRIVFFAQMVGIGTSMHNLKIKSWRSRSFAMPNPFVLTNKICLNQSQNLMVTSCMPLSIYRKHLSHFQEETPKPVEEEVKVPKQEFQPLTVSCPDGLQVTYLLESHVGIMPEAPDRNTLMVNILMTNTLVVNHVYS